ncbi:MULTISPECIES: glycosyltransferase family A protein [Providencia]|uniref:glycosyltransferase family A protein n=1 Tax=Providencia TaxID=586 RepID=UPI00234A44A6|nr:glycosyltransferase family 2 protein [Providencia sp. PROV110]
MQLSMLYATHGKRCLDLINNLPDRDNNTEIIIIHQTSSNDLVTQIKELLKTRHDVLYYQSDDIGVTKSRNLAISKASNDILFFCDDDVTYQHGIQKNILTAYEEYSSASFLTFSYSEDKNEYKAKKFKNHKFKHTLFTILSVGTIQISCKRHDVLENKIKFPEDMGAGAKYFLCDEPVFLSQFIKKNLTGYYLPLSIGYHPKESSGNIFNDKNAFTSRFLCFTRIFGKFNGRILYLIYLLKNIRNFNSIQNFFISTSLIFRI